MHRLRSQLLPKARPRRQRYNPHYRRGLTTQEPPPPPPTQSRLDKLNARLPRFLHRYTTPLATAPVSHITAFFILHEITAVAPLFGLFGVFHYFQISPPWVSDAAFNEGVQRFGGYLRKKGWLGEEAAGDGEDSPTGQNSRVLVEAACAYAVTKALLPVRLILSVWASPWFARSFVLPVSRLVGRVFGAAKAK